MKILAIDTSCDDTSVAVLENGRLLSNIISSQIEFHKQWGGVVPIIAKRNHQERIDFVINRALKVAGLKIEEIDIFAVTYGPGLAIALEIGVNKAKELAKKFGKKIIGVNHMMGHTYANFVINKNGVPLNKGLFESDIFPILILLISGGHTELVMMDKHMNFKKIGQTLDDSVGEAFDKISNMLGLGYPGGPIIEQLAKSGDTKAFKFPIPMKNSYSLDFSFSGLKTAVFREIQNLGKIEMSAFEKAGKNVEELEGRITLSKKPTYSLSRKQMEDISASFQSAAAEELAIKVRDALKNTNAKTLILGGGVVNNAYIRKILRKIAKKNDVKMYYPSNKKLLTDNAAMIGTAAYYMAQNDIFSDIETLDRNPSLSL